VKDGAHQRGSFCFAELHTPDPDRAAAFYGGLLGWTLTDAEGTGGDYRLCRLSTGEVVAALRRTAGGPQRWVGFVRVDDADGTVARAREGGAVVLEPTVGTPGLARTCVLQDADGGVFGLWEPAGREGADVQDRPGSLWWMELMARDVGAARTFYSTLFGWTLEETLKFDTPPYTIFRVAGESVAGAVQFDPEWGVPHRWQVFFAVDDYDASVARACAGGGALGFWRDVPAVGRLGVIIDPDDAIVLIMHPGYAAAPPAAGV
jgi:predicted enzyme related to lactoylglutathione lyase